MLIGPVALGARQPAEPGAGAGERVAFALRIEVVVSALADLFCAGRLLFWIGYAWRAAARAIGFGSTFCPSLAALIMGAGAALV